MCSTNFTQEEDLQLIELVRRNPSLWNESRERKMHIWDIIGQQLTRPKEGEECKCRWRSIRYYYKYKKHLQDPRIKQSGKVYRTSWNLLYWDSLRFLDGPCDDSNQEEKDFDFVDCENLESEVAADVLSAPRKRRKSSTLNDKNQQINEGSAKIKNEFPKQKEETVKFESEMSVEINAQERMLLNIGNARTISKNEFFQQAEESEHFKSEILERALDLDYQCSRQRLKPGNEESKNIPYEDGASEEAIQLFFKAIAMTVNKFSPKLKAEAKVKVLSVVKELQIKHLPSTFDFNT